MKKTTHAIGQQLQLNLPEPAPQEITYNGEGEPLPWEKEASDQKDRLEPKNTCTSYR